MRKVIAAGRRWTDHAITNTGSLEPTHVRSRRAEQGNTKHFERTWLGADFWMEQELKNPDREREGSRNPGHEFMPHCRVTAKHTF